MNTIKGIAITITIILFLFLILIIYSPKNKKFFEQYSNIPFKNNNKN